MDESANHSSFVPSEKWTSVPHYAQLSPTEMDCLTMVVNGQSTEKIAEALGCQPKSAKNHVASVFRKLSNLEDVGEYLSGYAHPQHAANLLIQHGYFEPAKEV